MTTGRRQSENYPDYTDLIWLLGQPIRRTLVLRRPRESKERYSYPFNRKRPGEVVLIIPRSRRSVLLHTKSFYPPDLFRLPTGGLMKNEKISEALRRELHEETGFDLTPRQFLFHLEVRMVERTRQRRFHSFGFLMSPAVDEPQPQDKNERIAGFKDVPVEKLRSVANRLRRLPTPWALWGRFRAMPHTMALRALEQREARGDPIWT